MKSNLKASNDIRKLIFISVTFTLVLLGVRALYAGSTSYFFYPWNLFLALIPLFFSKLLLRQKDFNVKSILLLIAWLLFLPNAPYLVTDIFHFEERPPVPQWFDLMLVVSGAWNGILLCMISMFQVERFLSMTCNPKFINSIMLLLLLPCGYGIYIGRFLRYNSWDVLTDPFDLLKTSTHHVHHPFENLNVWAFTLIFAAFLGIIYLTIKKLPRMLLTPGQ